MRDTCKRAVAEFRAWHTVPEPLEFFGSCAAQWRVGARLAVDRARYETIFAERGPGDVELRASFVLKLTANCVLIATARLKVGI